MKCTLLSYACKYYERQLRCVYYSIFLMLNDKITEIVLFGEKKHIEEECKIEDSFIEEE